MNQKPWWKYHLKDEAPKVEGLWEPKVRQKVTQDPSNKDRVASKERSGD